ncbi:MAG: sialidase family protein [Christensenellales bacterium]
MNILITQELLSAGSALPVINHDPLPRYAMANLDYGMTIGIAVTKSGRKFACWVGGGDNSKAFFLLSFQDPGRPWSEAILVIDPHDDKLPLDRCTIVGTLWVDPMGRLWLFFNQTLQHFDGRSSNWYIRCDDPDAEKPLWTEPVYISYGCTLNKPTVLDSGEWLLPVSLWARHHIVEPFTDCYRDLDDERMAHVFVSTDQGETWTHRGGVVFPETAFDEHMIVQRRDDSLWMIGRTHSMLMESFSNDNGRTWSKAAASPIVTVCSRTHLRRLKSGNLLLVKHGEHIDISPGKRSELTAFISKDDGKTWSQGFVLDERHAVSYPDSDQDENGVIYITYDRERDLRGEILMATLREEDILGGKLATPGARLKEVIRRPGLLKEE